MIRSLCVPVLLAGVAAAGSPPPVPVDALVREVRALGAPSYEERERAFERLLEWGGADPAAVLEVLPERSEDPETEVRCRALRDRIPGEVARRAARRQAADDAELSEAIDALFSGPSEGLAERLQAFVRTVRSLEGRPGRIGIAGRIVADAFLEWPDRRLRAEAARALGAFGDPSSAPRLVALLEGDDPETGHAAALALSFMRDAKPVAELIGLSASGRPSVRRLALLALKGGDDPRIDEAILRALKDAEPSVRASAVEVLASLLGPSQRWDIVALAPAVREDHPPLGERPLCRPRPSRRAPAAGADRDAALREAVVAMLKDPVPEVRFAAARVLGFPATAEGVRDALGLSTGDPEWDLFVEEAPPSE